MNKIETGYKISGRTWISDAWNAGTLTREDIEAAIERYSESEGVPDEDEIRAIEEVYVLEEMDEDATPAEIEARLNERRGERNGKHGAGGRCKARRCGSSTNVVRRLAG